MRKELVLIILVLFMFGCGLTGEAVSDSFGGGGVPAEEVECMEACIGVYCTIGDIECAEPYSADCQAECNAYEPTDISDDEQCVQDCLNSNCGEFDWDCQDAVIGSCDIECDMVGDAPDWDTLSDEEKCISECVAAIDPTLICGAGAEGETGGEICQVCADSCVYLYEGPCLLDEEITEKELACETCDHCYGSLVMGDSGDGYDCIVDIECGDSSSEFGDDAGSGPGIGDEDVVEEESSGFIENIFSWFGGWF